LYYNYPFRTNPGRLNFNSPSMVIRGLVGIGVTCHENLNNDS